MIESVSHLAALVEASCGSEFHELADRLPHVPGEGDLLTLCDRWCIFAVDRRRADLGVQQENPSRMRNIMTMGWHTVIEFTPSLVGCIIAEDNVSFAMIRNSRECVINVPTADQIGR